MPSRPLLDVKYDQTKGMLVAPKEHGGLLRISPSAPAPSPGGSTDHAALTNLGWLVSDHVSGVAAVRIAAFDATGATALYTASGTGTVVALATGATLGTPTLSSYAAWTDTTAAAGAAGRLQRNGANLSWHNGTAAKDLAQVAGQIGGTGDAPDVRGIRETGGPTLLTMGAIADQEVGYRDSSTFKGITMAALVIAGALAAITNLEYGDGFDGAVSYSADTTTSAEVRATNITFTSTGWSIKSFFPIMCTGTCTFQSAARFHNNGNSSSGVSAGGGGGAGATTYANNNWQGANGSGGRSTTGNGGNGSGAANSWGPYLSSAANVCDGGAGGAAGAQTGGTKGDAVISAANLRSIGHLEFVRGCGVNANYNGGGGGGAGGANVTGGGATSGGGGGGGGVFVARLRTLDATAGGDISSNGGGGGNATSAGGVAGGGGGGGGGVAGLLYSSAVSGTLPTMSATKGPKGTGAGGGNDGSDGVDGVTFTYKLLG